MAREDDPCKHAYPTRAACPQCSEEPDSSMRRVTVYITAGGEVYHFEIATHSNSVSNSSMTAGALALQ